MTEGLDPSEPAGRRAPEPRGDSSVRQGAPAVPDHLGGEVPPFPRRPRYASPSLPTRSTRATVFELVDQAVDFVMSKINRAVGTRAQGPQAPVTYDTASQDVVARPSSTPWPIGTTPSIRLRAGACSSPTASKSGTPDTLPSAAHPGNAARSPCHPCPTTR